MRKLWYAGAAIAGGFFLLGASPAQAAPQPGGTDPGQQPSGLLPAASGASQQLDNALGYTMNKTNGSRLSSTDPLGPGAPVTMSQGQNSTNVGGADLGSVVDDTASMPGSLTSPTESGQPGLPSADVVGNALPTTGTPVGDLPIKHVPFQKITSRILPTELAGGMPILGGLSPDGRAATTAAPTTEQTQQFDGGMPLLGGLGGMLPANGLPRDLVKGYTPSLPAGGMAVTPATTLPATTTPATTATPAPAATTPSVITPLTTAPTTAAPAPLSTGSPVKSAAKPAKNIAPADAQDPRLHEEPVDGEASHRTFTGDSRPVAGVDPQYK